MNAEIITYTIDEFKELNELENTSQAIDKWSCGLWFDDWEESNVNLIYLAWDEDFEEVLGFQTVNNDNQTIAIEINETHRGKGIARALIEESMSYIPERNENPEFWEWSYNEFN